MQLLYFVPDSFLTFRLAGKKALRNIFWPSMIWGPRTPPPPLRLNRKALILLFRYGLPHKLVVLQPIVPADLLVDAPVVCTHAVVPPTQLYWSQSLLSWQPTCRRISCIHTRSCAPTSCTAANCACRPTRRRTSCMHKHSCAPHPVVVEPIELAAYL